MTDTGYLDTRESSQAHKDDRDPDEDEDEECGKESWSEELVSGEDASFGARGWCRRLE
jgi:hypothetical protein